MIHADKLYFRSSEYNKNYVYFYSFAYGFSSEIEKNNAKICI